MAQNDTQPQRKGSKPISETSASGGGSRRVLWIVVGVAIALIVLLAAVALLNNGDSNSSTPEVATGQTVAERVGQPVDRRVVGDPAAPVLIEAYEDVQCPHCQRYTEALEDTILDELVAQGIARYEYKHRFVIGADSITAGTAMECAADQGLFWEYHNALFAAAPNNASAVQAASLKRLAADTGLDTDEFDQCFDSRKHYEKMLREDNEARDRNVDATPTIFINGVKYQGDFAPEPFIAAVKAAATATGS